MTIINTIDLVEESVKNKPIFVISDDDLTKAIKHSTSGEFLLDPKINYLIEPDEDDIEETCQEISFTKRIFKSILTNLYQDGLFNSGKVLLFDKDENSYLPYDRLMKKTIQSQMMNFFHFCQLLGAKEVNLNISQSKNESKTIDAKANLSAEDIFEAKTGFKNSIVSEVVEGMETNTKFQGSNKVDDRKAKAMIDSGVFGDNLGIQQLYNACTRSSNKIQSHKVAMNFAEDIRENLEVFAELDVPILKKSLGEASFNKLKNSSQKCTINYEVIF